MVPTAKRDEQYMREALKEAQRASETGEKAVGAVIVHRAQVIARAHHQTKTLRDPTAHAAVIAITQAANALQSDRLESAVLYVTQEPCAMCAGAALLSGVARLVFGAEDAKQGCCGSVDNLPAYEQLNRKLSVTKGMLALECAALLRKPAVKAKI